MAVSKNVKRQSVRVTVLTYVIDNLRTRVATVIDEHIEIPLRRQGVLKKVDARPLGHT